MKALSLSAADIQALSDSEEDNPQLFVASGLLSTEMMHDGSKGTDTNIHETVILSDAPFANKKALNDVITGSTKHCDATTSIVETSSKVACARNSESAEWLN